MELIEVRQDWGRSGGVVLRVDGYDYATTVVSPFDAEQEAELDWYFEEHLRFPFTDSIRARQAGQSVTAYGEELFRQLIGSDAAREAYGKLKDRAFPDKLAIAVIGSPAFQGLHWEALKDPRLPRPFALDVPIVRRGLAAAPPLEAGAADSPTFNLLVVTARPAGAYDVGYRTITRPIVATLRQARLRVAVDFVRPGTWQALVERLEAATRDYGAGHYHGIHFDLHGALLSYAELQKRQVASASADRLTFRGRWGRGEIGFYDGAKAFLNFMPVRDDAVGLAEAGEVAALLLKHKIPIAILNACQSGKQVGADETSLGARLLEAGVQSVLAMAWSVTVSAAKLLVHTLYADLFASRPLGVAVLAGRRALQADKTRRAAYSETIELEDWLLPVVYQNREPKLAFRQFTDEEAKLWYAEAADRSPEPKPEYDFFDRDLDVLRIETALLTRRNLLLVQGMGGSGKTTLLRHLAYWWELTGLVQRGFFFGWDQGAWTRAQILHTLAPKVLPLDAARAFDSMNEAAQQQAVAMALRAQRHLLILDNLESVTAAPLAIPHRLNERQRQELRSFLGALAGGTTLVLLGSRGEEGWLAAGTFADNVYHLEGLDPEAASELADAVLQRAGAQERREELAFRDLMTLLAGYPLALQVVLPNLATKTAAKVLDELRQGLAEVDADRDGDPVLARTRSLMACIEYSHGNLDSEAQALLLCLAPFTGVIDTGLLKAYERGLSQQPELGDLPLARIEEVLESARQLGLLQRDPVYARLLRPQPALGWFLTSRLNAENQRERCRAIRRAFRKLYLNLAIELFQKQTSNEPEDRSFAQTWIEFEYANLHSAMTLDLDDLTPQDRQPFIVPYQVLSSYLDRLQDHQRGIELGCFVLARLEEMPQELLEGPLLNELIAIIDGIAARQLELRLFDSAKANYQRVLALHDRRTGLDERTALLNRAAVKWNLGNIELEQRRFREAEAAFENALKVYSAYEDRESVGKLYHQLGRVAEDELRFGEADAAYKKSLAISLAQNDRLGSALTYHQLGRIAAEEHRFAEAEAAFANALKIYLAYDERHSAAGTYLHLGTVALNRGRIEKAETALKNALDIYLAFDDQLGAAKAYHQIGMVSERRRRFEEAEAAYKKALKIKIDLDERYSAANSYLQLGNLALRRRQFGEAGTALRSALDIFLVFNDHQNAAKAYCSLGIVAEMQRQFREAETLYKTALGILFKPGDSYEKIGPLVYNLARLWRETNDDGIVTDVGMVLGADRGDVLAMFQAAAKEHPA